MVQKYLALFFFVFLNFQILLNSQGQRQGIKVGSGSSLLNFNFFPFEAFTRCGRDVAS